MYWYYCYQLKKANGAVLYHCSDAINLETGHEFCPKASDGWCQFQADKCNGTSLYKEKPRLPSVIRDKIRPIFLDLSDENLLSKCLHGKTQNNNESINNVIQKRCPKDINVGRNTLEFGVASAVVCFNDGISGILNVFKKLNIPHGTYTTKFCKGKDDDRIVVMEKKSSDKVKSRRKQLHAKKKGFIHANEEKEDTVYGAGLFQMINEVKHSKVLKLFLEFVYVASLCKFLILSFIVLAVNLINKNFP